MKAILFMMFLLLPLSSVAAGIKKISNTEFAYNNNGRTIKIVIEKPIGAVTYIAVIRQAEYIRFLIRTSDGNFYLHHEVGQLPPSPVVDLFKHLTRNQPTPLISTADFFSLAQTGTFPGEQEPARAPRFFMVTTPLIEVHRSSSGEECYITPAHEDKQFVEVMGGHYFILTDAHFSSASP